MAFEIEHKYLVVDDSYKEMQTEVLHIRQGYLSREPERTVRVRTVDDRGYVTIKGITKGAVRHEYEYEVPLDDAKEMLEMCVPPVIEKFRHIVPFKGHEWEVDEFAGELNHVVLAEIELNSPDEKYDIPPFIGVEITGNPDFYNSNIHNHIPMK